MPKRNLMIVGLDLPWEHAESVSITSKRSLLDADIIVFNPVLHFETDDRKDGKPSFDDDDTFKIKECMSHWRSEITAAMSAGKTVIVLLVDQDTFYIGTGERRRSGTGRNEKITRIVKAATNYDMLPFELPKLRNVIGLKIKREQQLWPIARYWQMVEDISQYRVTYQPEAGTPLLKTADGSQVVSSIISSNGSTIFVPDFIEPDELTEEDEESEDFDEKWTAEAVAFTKRLEPAFFALDGDLRSLTTSEPAPEWVSAHANRLPNESVIQLAIIDTSERIAALQLEHRQKLEELDNYTAIKALLFAKGHMLANAVISALRELGFDADRYDDGASEFDVVFSADGFRYIGEVEGKDDKAIQIDKSSQLERNIQEDFQRADVNEYARGALFGNAYRLTEPSLRNQSFSDKVFTAADRTGIRLICTADLYRAVQEFRRNPSGAFATECRKAIHDQCGKRVEFPQGDSPPKEIDAK